MKYIFQDNSGAFDLTKYQDYLDRERQASVGRIHGPELLTLDRFVPTGPGSFHDARFERLVATTRTAEHEGGEAQSAVLELRLEGPYFDRHFELQYDGVESCSLELPGPEDDLLMHEVRSEDGLLVHELRFDEEKAIEVVCRGIRFSEELMRGEA